MADFGTSLLDGTPDSESAAGPPSRVAVVYERTGAGEAVLREGAELANGGRMLAVLTLAPLARPMRWSRAAGEGLFNLAVREEAALELKEAREMLGSVASRASFNVLAGHPQPPLAAWVAAQGIGLVLLPRRRFTRRGNLFVRSLRRETSAEIRLIS